MAWAATELVRVKREIAAITPAELRGYRAFAARQTPGCQLENVTTDAMREMWARASAEVARLEPAARRLADGQVMGRLMQEHAAVVVSRSGAGAVCSTCNVCFNRAAPPDAGIVCTAAHFTCQGCFCAAMPGACALGGRADVEKPGKPRGAFRCMECPALLSDSQVVEQVYKDPAAFSAYKAVAVRAAIAAAEASAAAEAEAAAVRREDGGACVEHALFIGGIVCCPHCGYGGPKDDECMHIACQHCQTDFCYCCGGDAGDCPRGEDGCDSVNAYLQSHPAGERFGGGRGCMVEVHRRRTSAMLQVARPPRHPTRARLNPCSRSGKLRVVY
jgi:hypothetical protein